MNPENTEVKFDRNKQRVISFRGRRKNDGKIVYGNYLFITRKAYLHIIVTQEDNQEHEIYRESLQQQDIEGNWENV